uniref:C2H2-type domain-containing protein n=1 Tax=Anopheles farauti TaxID=69004 RepID=A0A182QX07_9DIPT
MEQEGKMAPGEDEPTESAMAERTASDMLTPPSTPPTKRGKSSHRYRCDQCSETFKRQDALNRHRFQHTGVHAFQCLEAGCGKAYTNRSHLLRHVRAKHLERSADQQPPRRPCRHPGCDKMFASEQKMMRHFRDLHLNNNLRYKCDECGEQFTRKVQLRWHRYHHTGQYPHRCEPCGENFTNLKALQRHRCRARAVQCTGCERTFQRWSEMVTHRRLEHPTVYRCERCEKQFHTRCALKQHARIHRTTDGTGEPDDVRDVYQCPYDGCPRFYEHERNLYAHIRSKHEGRKREDHICPVPNCGRVLATRQKLNQHRKLHLRAAKVKAAVRPKEPKEQKEQRPAPVVEPLTDSEVESGVPAVPELLSCNVQRLLADLEAMRAENSELAVQL